MNNTRRLAFSLLALGALASARGAAQERPGMSAVPALQIPVGARAMGMGTAFTAVADDISALHYNPGGLATLSRRELSFMYLKGLDDHSLEYVAFGSPLSFPGATGSGYSSLGGSLLLSQNGDMEVNRTNPDGSLRDSRAISAGGDLVLTLTYAERVLESLFRYPRGSAHVNHFVGVSAKAIRSTLAEDYSAVAAAADIGYLARSPELGWSAGLSLLNMGTKVKYVEQKDPLPLTLRAGGAWRMIPSESYTLNLAADGDYLYYDRQWRVNTGVECRAARYVAGRLGYRFHHDTAGLTFGFGVSWEAFTMDYAWAMSSAIDDTHRFSFTYRFGQESVREPRKTRMSYFGDKPKRRQAPRPARPQPREKPVEQGVPTWIY